MSTCDTGQVARRCRLTRPAAGGMGGASDASKGASVAACARLLRESARARLARQPLCPVAVDALLCGGGARGILAARSSA